MSDDRRFDYLLTRIRTRESSTLVIATVASSASLILFGIGYKSPLPYPVLEVAGWGIPLLGVLYRELTSLTNQADENEVRNLLPRRDNHHIGVVGLFREYFFVILLLIPSYLWSLRLHSNNHVIDILIIYLLLGVVIVIFEYIVRN